VSAVLAPFALPLLALALRATLLLALAFLADRALRRAPAAARHAVWVAAFAGLALLPVLGGALPGVALPVLPGALVVDEANGSTGGVEAAGGLVTASTANETTDGSTGGAEQGAVDTDGAGAAKPAGGATMPAEAENRLAASRGGDSGNRFEAEPQQAAPGTAENALGWLTGRAGSTAAALVALAVGPAGALAVGVAAAGSIALLLYLLLGLLRAAHLRRGARALDSDPRWRALLDEAVAEQSPRRRPGLAASDAIALPILCGLRRPTILLPAAVSAWSEAERRRVLAHEVAHAARRDGLWQVAARAVVALFWWHPLAWRALGRLVLAAELACDDRVLAGGAAGPEYARQLLDLARPEPRRRGRLAAPRPVAVAMARRPDLAVRIRALLDEARPRGPLPRAATVAAGVALVAAAALLAPVRLVAADSGWAVVAPGLAAGGTAAGGAIDSEANGAADFRADADLDVDLDARHDPEPGAAAGSDGAATVRWAAVGERLDRAWIRESVGRQRHRMTPLMRAAFAGDRVEVRRLLEGGADADDAVRGLGSPLILAADAGDAALVDLLLRHGADPDRAETGGERPGDLQRTPLGSAARSGDLATVERLLAAGATVDAAPRGDGTPLMTASRYGYAPLARRLLAAGADPDAAIRGDGTPLIEAARNGHLDVVDLLLEAGAPPDTAVRGDGNPLIVAADEGHREVLVRLLDAGADPDVWVPGDESALYHAIERGDAWMVERLLAAGADVSGRWPEEEGPLELARESGSRRVVEMLRQAGARR
jgi:ankyrin repeat protein/beta-lactamase regulating signal transducer with metallopeptidase domain